jgi:FtsP/CotA-like multicopper oxidase with cupredoxin domain
MTQIARDGLTLPQFYKSDTVWVSPGYRADVMVKMPSENQTLCLVGRRVTDQLDGHGGRADDRGEL